MDRSIEFFTAAKTITSRAAIPPVVSQNRTQMSKSEFAKAASTIGKELNATMLKLQQLATLAKSKSLFDDKPMEINELIFVIKQDIAKVHKQINLLQNYVNQRKGQGQVLNKQVEEHSSQVLFSLQSKLATTSNQFQNVLEERNQNMKEQKSRRDEYSSAFSITQPQQSDSPLYLSQNTTGAHQQDSNTTSQMRQRNPTNGPSDTVIELGSDTFGFQQQSLVTNTINTEILDSRSQAIESIESTIAELGQIYQNFAQLLSSQREVVQRIDDNILDTEANVIGAHNQLLRYYQNISSNRWLMMKIFATVIFFAFIFIVFLQ